MSKNSEAIKRRSSESAEFKQAFEEEQAKLDFADLLFELRQQTGLNQTVFAKKVNKSRSTIARIESARMEPSFSMLEDIAQALGKHVEIRFVDVKQAAVKKTVRQTLEYNSFKTDGVNSIGLFSMINKRLLFGKALRWSSDERGAHRNWWCAGEISSCERMLAGGVSMAGDRTPAKPLWSEVMICLGDFLQQRTPLQEKTASFDKKGAHRRTDLRRLLSSGERMLAGGGSVVGGHTPAKPLWSEVIIFLDDLLRQRTPLQEESASSDESVIHRKIDSASEISSGERMFAGGGSVAGGCTPAKPLWSKVMIYLGDFLRQRIPLQEKTASFDKKGAHRSIDLRPLASSGERMLAGAGSVAGGRTSAKPLWSEVMIILGVVLRRENARRNWAFLGTKNSAERPLYRRKPPSQTSPL